MVFLQDLTDCQLLRNFVYYKELLTTLYVSFGVGCQRLATNFPSKLAFLPSLISVGFILYLASLLVREVKEGRRYFGQQR